MRRPRARLSLIAVFAAVASFAIGTIALAHEIEHDLDRHDEPTCGLHLYLGHATRHATNPATFVANVTPDTYLPIQSVRAFHGAPTLAYRGRAPPSRDPVRI